MKEELETFRDAAKASANLSDTINRVSALIESLIGESVRESGQIFGDWFRHLRYRNLLRIHDKVTASRSERFLTGKTNPIPLKLAVPILEYSSLEEDDSLQDLWANLITNALDPDYKEPIRPGFVSALNQLCADEALILEGLRGHPNFPNIFSYKAEIKSNDRFGGYPEFDGPRCDFLKWQESLNLKNSENSEEYLDNLLRSKMIELVSGFSHSANLSSNSIYQEDNYIEVVMIRNELLHVTLYGMAFLNATSPTPNNKGCSER